MVAQHLQRACQLRTVAEAHLRHFFQATQNNVFQGQRYVRIELAGRSWRVLNMLHGHRYWRIAIERRAAGEHFIHDDAQRIDIGSRANDVALCLLRWVVLNSPQGHPGGGESFIIDIFIDTGDAEVGQFNGAITTYQHILWFHVAMDDPTTMCGTQAKGDVVGNNDGAINIKYTPGTQITTQIGALY